MDATLASALVTGGGVAGVFCVLFIVGAVVPRSVVQDKDKVIAEKDRQIAAKDLQVAESTQALFASKDVIASLQQGMIFSGRFPPSAWQPPPPPPAPPSLPGGGSGDRAQA